MTVTMERAGGAPPTTASRPGALGLLLPVLPWLVPAAVLLLALHHTGTPDKDTALYAVYYVVAIMLPGTLTYRALRGSRGNLPEDLGLGTATGLVVLLIGWALCAATRLQVLLPGWPLLVIVLFLAVPGLRRHWRIPADERKPLPLAWSWIMAGALLVLVLAEYPNFHNIPLPPATTAYYQDLMYHLALVHEMTRSIPFQVPEVAGDTLRYHYLSDADMAIASMITKIPAPVVLLRLWIVPISGLVAFVIAALGRQISGKWWAGALSGAAAVVALPLTLGAPTSAMGGPPIALVSPSEVYSIPLLGLLVVIAVDVLSGRRLGWAWAIVFPLAVACAGAKSSALPPFVAGLFLALVVVGLRYRDRLKATAILFGVTLVAMLVGAKIFAGGGASALALQPLAVLFWNEPYRTTIGSQDTINGTLALPLGVSRAGLGQALFIAGLCAWWLLMQAPRLLGLFTLVGKRTRDQPAVWLLSGIAVAGTGGMWLLWHPSASQVYFYLGVIPFGAALTVWLLADQARSWRPVVAGLAAGAVWVLVAPKLDKPAHSSVAAWIKVLTIPVLITAVVALVVGAIVLVAWRFRSGRYAWQAIPVGLIAAVIGGGLATGVSTQVQGAHKAYAASPVATPSSKATTAAEMRAALWLNDHTGNDDIIATNVHCQPITWRAVCDARAFWVDGLGGRRSLIESWGYTDQAVAADGVNGKRYNYQPAPYPDRFALNQRVFATGDAADVATLRDTYHVKWLFADSRAVGGVSPNLTRVARLVYTSGPVTIYQL